MSAARNRANADKSPWPVVFGRYAELALRRTGYFPDEVQDAIAKGSGQAFVRMWNNGGFKPGEKDLLRPYFKAMGIVWMDKNTEDEP